MPSFYESHRSFLLRLLAATVLVDLVFAVTDFWAYFAPFPIAVSTYDLLQLLFPISVLVAILGASYFLVFRYLAPGRRRLVASLLVLPVSLVYGFLLGVVFFVVQLLPIYWLNGPLWPPEPMLSMSLAATIALYAFPALAFALAAGTVAGVALRKKGRSKARRRTA